MTDPAVPYVLPVTDAAVLAQSVDGVLLVIDAGETRRGIAQHAVESLRQVGANVIGSVLFCDIVGFTQLSSQLPPEQVGALVNDYFGSFARAGSFCKGTVNKFIGDCVMILFGVPEPYS